MVTLLLYGVLAIAAVVALFGLAVWLLPRGEQISPAVADAAPWQLVGDRPLDASDVIAVRLPVALRGYRFAETDVLLDRLSEELRIRDAELAQLRTLVAAHPPAGAGVEPPSDEEDADLVARGAVDLRKTPPDHSPWQPVPPGSEPHDA